MYKTPYHLTIILLCAILHTLKGDVIERKDDGDTFQGTGCLKGCSCRQATHVFGEIFADSKCATDYRLEFGMKILKIYLFFHYSILLIITYKEAQNNQKRFSEDGR